MGLHFDAYPTCEAARAEGAANWVCAVFLSGEWVGEVVGSSRREVLSKAHAEGPAMCDVCHGCGRLCTNPFGKAAPSCWVCLRKARRAARTVAFTPLDATVGEAALAALKAAGHPVEVSAKDVSALGAALAAAMRGGQPVKVVQRKEVATVPVNGRKLCVHDLESCDYC
jgi:hypothetical protein